MTEGPTANGDASPQETLLRVLDDAWARGDDVDSLGLCTLTSWDHDRVVGLLKSLDSRHMVLLDQGEKTMWSLTSEGEEYAATGTPEARVFEHVRANGGEMSMDLFKQEMSTPAGDIGLKNAMKAKWLVFNRGTKTLTCGMESVNDVVCEQLETLKKNANEAAKQLGDKPLQELKKRKLVEVRSLKFYRVAKGPQFSLEVRTLATDLKQEHLLNDGWKNLEFKPYNFYAAGKKPTRGTVHPIRRVEAKFRRILMNMGFEEMPTNNWVEDSFWNFDSLFQPQQHPARDAHDTFFLKNPSRANEDKIPKEYLERVKKMHEEGGDGSIGWRYTWSKDESLKNILRTHTTSNSSRMLYQLAQEYKRTGVFTPRRYFSIDRVFRNETLDATHLAEFHQVEGLIADFNISLGHLIGVFKAFYRKIGITDLSFKPAYNPYTEPSLEIFGYHPLLKKRIEVGNSGMFRPEMLRPMGLPPNVTVIAWGLSLERPTMIRYGCRNIRELFGHRAALGVL